MRKGDIAWIKGKLRFKRQEDGQVRGKIYDAVVSTFTPTADRDEIQPNVQFE